MRLYLLYLGTMQPGDIPVPGYLIQTHEGMKRAGQKWASTFQSQSGDMGPSLSTLSSD